MSETTRVEPPAQSIEYCNVFDFCNMLVRADDNRALDRIINLVNSGERYSVEKFIRDYRPGDPTCYEEKKSRFLI